MSMFKVGDKVVRKAHKNTSSFKSYQGDFAYYVITDITTSGHLLQLDNLTDGGEDLCPWYAANFELYQEPADELPPVPGKVAYMNSKRDPGNDQRLVLEKDNGDGEGLMYIGVVPKKGSTRAKVEIGINIDPDSALQLAHDIRRMAMSVKRERK